MQSILKRLTYANVMSTIAVFLVVGGGAAFAAGKLAKNSVGSNQLKKNSVTAAKIKASAVTGAKLAANSVIGTNVQDGSLTGSDINLSTLGKVPSATNAEHATSADRATNADNAANAAHADSATNAVHADTADSFELAHVFSAGAVPAAATEANAPKVELGSVGPFNFYGKCFEKGTGVFEGTYIELTSGTATLGSEGGANFNSGEYLTPASPEAERLMKGTEASENEFNAESDDEEFQASASDGTEITGEIGGVGAKSGAPAAGNGPFLSGNSCIVGTIAVFGD